jgi:hypothetical protein
VRTALRAAAQAGPFFALALRDQAPGPEWRPAAQLRRADLAGLVAGTAEQLGTSETRVAASIVQQGLAARLWSPVLACALLHGLVPDLSSVLIAAGPPIRLGLTQVAGWQADSGRELAQLAARTIRGPLAVLGAALPARLPDGLLRGNSASAAVGALSVLAVRQPGLARSAAVLGRELVRATDLAGTGELGSGLAFRRRSCCLYYRIPDGGLCGDCCHETAPE